MSEIRKCIKCSNPATLCGVDVKKAAYCKPCFLQMVKHKFSSAIGKRRLYKDGERKETLIIYNGTNAGAFLLSVVSQGLQASAHKRLAAIPTVMVLLKQTEKSVIEDIKAQVQCFQGCISAPWIYVHIAAIFNSDLPDPRTSSDICGTDQIPKWTQLLNSCESETIREELERLCMNLICVRIAKRLNITKVMLPLSADKLAITALTSLAFARGPAIYHLVNVVDKSYGVTLIRPLREITEKELALVNRFEGSNRFIINVHNNHAVEFNEEQSVQSVTRDFINLLITDGFVSTVTTILSTANKLQSPVANTSCCALCFSAYAPENNERYCYACMAIMAEIGNKSLLEELVNYVGSTKH